MPVREDPEEEAVRIGKSLDRGFAQHESFIKRGAKFRKQADQVWETLMGLLGHYEQHCEETGLVAGPRSEFMEWRFQVNTGKTKLNFGEWRDIDVGPDHNSADRMETGDGGAVPGGVAVLHPIGQQGQLLNPISSGGAAGA